MNKATIHKVTQPLRGAINPPTSKSLSNRALLIAALAKGDSQLTGLLESDDTTYMRDCLRKIGVGVSNDKSEPNVTHIAGVDMVQPNSDTFYVGNAGTVARFFSAAAALSKTSLTLDGDPAMRKRPISPLLASLKQIGLNASSDTGFFPITVGGEWTQQSDVITVDADNSSQYISALMMIAPYLPNGLTIQTKTPDVKDGFGYIDLTMQTMQHFGANVHVLVDGHKWQIDHGEYQARDYTVEADASAMTYIWAAETLTDGEISTGFNPDSSPQPDARSHSILKNYKSMPAELDCSMMQDSVPTIAVLAALSAKKVRLTGLRNLRVKECDRVQAIFNELSKFDADIVSVDVDDLIIDGSSDAIIKSTHPVDIETYHDHRIAMAFSLLGLVRNGVTILDPGCASKTYPNYWNDLKAVGVTIDMQ